MFCDKCGGIGVPEDGMFFCNDCGKRIFVKAIKQEIISKDLGVNKASVPKPYGNVYFHCPNCNNLKGERYEIPPQYGDEDSAFFVKCSNCGFSHKEEGSKTG